MLKGKLRGVSTLKGSIQRESIGTGTTDYEKLKNLPSINDVELVGNKTGEELGLANKSDIPVVPTKVSAFENDAGYLTEIPSEYITENELDNKGYLTSIPDEYITETELNDKGYATTGEVESAVKDKATTGYVDDKFNGANKAVSFVNYSAMISSLNALANTSYSVGQNIMIVTLAVPDLWVSEIAEESVAYTYVSDDDFVNELNTNGSVQVGYYKLSALETQKVDLTDYVKNTDYATTLKAGVTISADDSALMNERYGKNGEMPYVPSIRLSFAVKRGLINGKCNWTDEEKASARGLLGAVGSTDYATQTKAGLITFSSNYGMQLIGTTLAPLTWEAYITNRTNAFMSYAMLDTIVKAGITTNKQPLTDEEKTKAKNWLGVQIPTFEATQLEDGSYSLTIGG